MEIVAQQVGVSHRDWGVSKSYKSETDVDAGSKKLTWNTNVTLPDTTLTEFVYKDTFIDASDGNTGKHYGIANELQAEIEKNFSYNLVIIRNFHMKMIK